MALLNRFVLLVDYSIELICLYIFFIELTFNFFSVSVALMSIFSTSMDIPDSVCVSSVGSSFVDLFLVCFHPSLGFCVLLSIVRFLLNIVIPVSCFYRGFGHQGI